MDLLLENVAVLMPTRRPLLSASTPPEFPLLIAASVCIESHNVSSTCQLAQLGEGGAPCPLTDAGRKLLIRRLSSQLMLAMIVLLRRVEAVHNATIRENGVQSKV